MKGVTIQPGRKVKITGKGAALGHALASDPNPVHVTLTTGGKRYCMRFGGTVKFRSGRSYAAKLAPAPVTCAP